MAEKLGSRSASHDQRQCFFPTIERPPPGGGCEVGVEREWTQPRVSGPRADRELHDRKGRASAGHPGSTEGLACPTRNRRLRNRLLIAELSPATSVRHSENRPLFHPQTEHWTRAPDIR